MERLVLSRGPELEVSVKRNRRARRLSLRVSRMDGRVSLTMPTGVSLSKGVAFLKSKEGWVREQVSSSVRAIQVSEATELPFEGRMLSVSQAPVKSASLGDGRLIVPQDQTRIAPSLIAFYKQAARARLHGSSEHYSDRLGRNFQKITLRDTRSRWGSCTATGNLMYSWRLIMCPPDVLDYVAAHEVCHLEHMNHSAEFWRSVERIFGPYDKQRAWLRTNGPELHRYIFTERD